jgi:hypothetical protein
VVVAATVKVYSRYMGMVRTRLTTMVISYGTGIQRVFMWAFIFYTATMEGSMVGIGSFWQNPSINCCIHLRSIERSICSRYIICSLSLSLSLTTEACGKKGQ